MKQLFCILLLSALMLSASAQTASRSGSDIKLNGTILSPQEKAQLLSDINGTDFTDEWNQAARRSRTGRALTISGGIATGAGLLGAAAGILLSATGAIIGSTAGAMVGNAVTGAQEGAKAGEPLTTISTIVGGAGLVALGVGIPLLVSNNKKMNSILDRYNDDRPVAQLDFGPTAHGVGFILKF